MFIFIQFLLTYYSISTFSANIMLLIHTSLCAELILFVYYKIKLFFLDTLEKHYLNEMNRSISV